VPWKLTVRSGPLVESDRFDELADALDALETRAKQLAATTSNAPIDVKVRQFEPVQQVAARLELSGPQRLLPSVRGGVDVRGDGSTEAYTGGIRRQLLEQRRGETPYRALRRALTSGTRAA
jgi:hypothetical protein